MKISEFLRRHRVDVKLEAWQKKKNPRPSIITHKFLLAKNYCFLFIFLYSKIVYKILNLSPNSDSSWHFKCRSWAFNSQLLEDLWLHTLMAGLLDFDRNICRNDHICYSVLSPSCWYSFATCQYFQVHWTLGHCF